METVWLSGGPLDGKAIVIKAGQYAVSFPVLEGKPRGGEPVTEVEYRRTSRHTDKGLPIFEPVAS